MSCRRPYPQAEYPNSVHINVLRWTHCQPSTEPDKARFPDWGFQICSPLFGEDSHFD